MTKSISLRFGDIRRVNDFIRLTKKYDGRVSVKADKGSSLMEIDGKDVSVRIVAEGSEDSLSELIDTYRLCGLAS